MFRRVLFIGMGILVLLARCGPLWAQQAAAGSFVYLEDGQGSPFYLRNGSQVFSSSAAGYLILHGLKPGTYRVSIGFPRNEYPEMQFDLPVRASRDEGFLIRRRGSGSQFELYNLESAVALEPLDQARINAGDQLARLSPDAGKDVASTGGGSAQNSPQSPAQSSPQASPETPAPLAAAASNPASGASTDQHLETLLNQGAPAASTEPSAVNAPAASRPEVNQSPSYATTNTSPQVGNSGSGGLQFITFQSDSGSLSPAASMSVEDSTMADASNRSSAALEKAIQQRWKQLFHKSRKTASPSEEPLPGAERQPAPAATPAAAASGTPQTAAQAPAREFQRWRRQLASRSDDASMLGYARAHLSESPHFSCQQLQSLSYLFLTDATRLDFLKLWVNRVSDPSNFASLGQVFGSDAIRQAFSQWLRQHPPGS